MKTLRAYLLLCVIFLLLVSSAPAQTTNATLSGLVVDPTGAVIVGASVQAINDGTNVAFPTATNKEGVYVLPNLPPGRYHVQVSKSGFKTLIKPDITLNLQDARAINFTLEVGATSETVTVEGGAPMVQTQTAAVSTVIDQTYVKNMPLNGRSFQDLILLTPGITTATPQQGSTIGSSGEFSVNGQRTESNYYAVDGVSANVGASASGNDILIGAGASGSVPAGTALGTTQALVSVDELQEFRVQTSTYSAEYGRNPGGQFAFETKSGTNLFHGTAYEYLRNGYFDAADWFDNYFGNKKAPLRQNDFGGTLGGPLTIPGVYNGKDKTFFFLSYEGLRLTAPQASTVNYVPNLYERANTPSPLKEVLNAFPVPNGPEVTCDPAADWACPADGKTGLAEFIGNGSTPNSINSTSIRFDHAVNNRTTLFFRFNNTGSSSAVRGTYFNYSTPSSITQADYTIRTYTAGVNSALTNRLSNQFRVNYTDNETKNWMYLDNFAGSTAVDLLHLAGFGPGATVAVNFSYDGWVYNFWLAQQAQSAAQRQWNLVDTVNLSLGSHQLKYGVDYRRLTPFLIRTTPVASYNYYYPESILANIADGTGFNVYAPAYPVYTNFSAFVQDEWRVSSRLSLSMGVRWDVNPAPGVTQGTMPYTLTGTDSNNFTLAPLGTPLWQTAWRNFAPRLGAAYALRDKPGRETVVRGGAGIFFDSGNQLGSVGTFYGLGYAAGTGTSGLPFPAVPATPVIQNPPQPPYGAQTGFDPHLQLPYTVQWNASIEQALGKAQALTVSYIGAHAERLLRYTYYFPPSNHNFSGYFTFVSNGLTSDYNSLQVQFNRRLSRGLTALGSYTWSHCQDYGSRNFTTSQLRGNCENDLRHNFSAAVSYDVPSLGNHAFAQALFHHWGLDGSFVARTAFPVDLRGFGKADPGTGQYIYRGVNFVPGQPEYIYGTHCAEVYATNFGSTLPCPGGRAINPDAFTYVFCSDCNGNVPRNSLRLFGAWQMNLAVRREFPLRERLKLQFRAETFNVFNHANFGYVDTYLGGPTGGQAVSTLAGSLGNLNALYQMGGPRSMQFALKLVF